MNVKDLAPIIESNVCKQFFAREKVRELLEALRDPSPEMLDAGRKHGAQFPLEAWQAMIDEVLK